MVWDLVGDGDLLVFDVLLLKGEWIEVIDVVCGSCWIVIFENGCLFVVLFVMCDGMLLFCDWLIV